jgi:uncharacterized Fe-S cluster protein YjdI
MAAKSYTNGEITVSYDADICTHAGRCVKGLPSVFDAERTPWIDPDGASADQVAAQVAKCPSRALKFFRNAEQDG